MNATFGVAEEWALEVDTKGTRACAVAGLAAGNCFAECIERAERPVDGCSHRGGAVAGDAVFRDKAFEGNEARVGAFHHVVASAAVDVKVDEPRGENRVSEIQDLPISGSVDM